MGADFGVSDVVFEDGYASTAAGRIHYLKAGSGTPLLLLHGLVGSAHNWRQNIAYLSQKFCVYALDLPNMGRSDRIHGTDASLEATADTIAACMNVLGLERANVAGHSHGGAIAMMLAARHPKRVGSLVLYAPANPYCNLGRKLIDFYQTGHGIWLARQIPWFPRTIKKIALRRMYGDPRRMREDALDGYIHGLEIPGTIDHVLSILRGWTVGMERLRLQLEHLAEKPVLLIWGDHDQTVGLSSARILRRVMKKSQLVVLSGVGHIPFEELPEECNRTMTSWLTGLSV